MVASMNGRGLRVTLPSDREILMTREFRAPRPLVFDVMTQPEHLRRWMYGPEGWNFVSCEVDLRPGGGYRFLYRGPAGELMGTRGEYREVQRPARLVAREVFDPFDDVDGEVLAWPASPEGESVSTITLLERDGLTTYTNVFEYRTREARDAALATGMDQGMAAGFDRLDAILDEVAA